MNFPPVYATLTVPARMIRRGDEFQLHRRPRVATGSPGVGEYGSAVVPLEGGGLAWLKREQPIEVRRPVGYAAPVAGDYVRLPSGDVHRVTSTWTSGRDLRVELDNGLSRFAGSVTVVDPPCATD